MVHHIRTIHTVQPTNHIITQVQSPLDDHVKTACALNHSTETNAKPKVNIHYWTPKWGTFWLGRVNKARRGLYDDERHRPVTWDLQHYKLNLHFNSERTARRQSGLICARYHSYARARTRALTLRPCRVFTEHIHLAAVLDGEEEYWYIRGIRVRVRGDGDASAEFMRPLYDSGLLMRSLEPVVTIRTSL